MSTLDRLIDPVPRDTFLKWSSEPTHVHVRRDEAGYFDWVFSAVDADELLARNNLRYPTLKIWLKGEHLEPRRFTRAWHDGERHYADLIDMDRALALFDQGATLSILRLEKLSASVGGLNAALEQETGFAVNTTAFLTPPDAANISAHYDNQDFFVLQISGSKRWRLWPRAEDKSAVSGEQSTDLPGEVTVSNDRLAADLELSAGDTLFVPRGMIHEVLTTTRHSIHLTIEVNRPRRLDLAEALLDRAIGSLTEHEEARRAIPTTVGWQTPRARDDVRRRLQKLLDLLGREMAVW